MISTAIPAKLISVKTWRAQPTEQPVARWAERTAHAIPLLVLPWCLWRLPFGFGFTMGMAEDQGSLAGWAPFYVFGLSIFSEGAAHLAYGLVRGWGEVVPRWVPRLAGRRIPPLAAVVPATVGGLVMTGVLIQTVLIWLHTPGMKGPEYSSAWWRLLSDICIAPGLLWGPLVLLLTRAYYVRRSRSESRIRR
ncbi:hypothetical protein [Catenulispora subtropica]|uniref:Uncharacterized protein n=1 Tax=Catenulispora subtropica TaxID=450798 RepID=A0ABN2R742_9ACTN